MDLKTTFLDGDLEEEIYMQQREGFVENGKEILVCQLNKSLYGLKQAPREWYQNFESFMVDHGFQKMQAYHYVFIKKYDGGDSLILLLFVDDMLIIRQDPKRIKSLKKAPRKSFAMKDMDPAKKSWECTLSETGQRDCYGCHRRST